MDAERVQCLIIGSGPAGFTAAIYAARAGLTPIIYQGGQPGGQLTITNDVENYPGYSQGIKGPEMMLDLQRQAERFGTQVRSGIVTRVNFSDQVGGMHQLWVDNTHLIETKAVIIATGASAKWLGLESERRLESKGVSACAVCDGFFFRGQDVVVVGGGDTACEEASYLAKLCRKVYMVVRRDELRASRIMQHRIKALHNIELLWNRETVEILGEEEVEGVKLRDTRTGEESVLKVQGFFIAIGHQPNTAIFKDQILLEENGYIATHKGSTRTSKPGVFACGDAQDYVYRQAITAAGTGCMAALDAERYLAESEAETEIRRMDRVEAQTETL